MKKNLYAILFSILFLNASAQFTYQWTNAAGLTGADYGKAVATDAAGNVYVSGAFTGTVNFSTGGAQVNLSASGVDVFLAKYDSNGNLVYAKKIGGSDDEVPYDIYVSTTDVYVVGKFKGTCDFDPSANSAPLTYLGGGTDGDGFVAKYDLAGNYQWAFKLGSTANDRTLGVTGDNSGDIVVSGFISNTVDFDPGTGTANLTAQANTYNSYFAKYTSAGNYVFAKLLVGDYNEANDIKTDANGDIFILGDWSETVDVDPSGATVNITTSSQLNFNAYLVKYSTTGNYIWHKTTTGNGINMGTQLAIDANNIFVGGVFTVTCDFDPIGTATLTSAGGSDLFIAKYDLSGAYQFAKKVGGPTNDFLNGLDIDAGGSIFITGKFTGTNIDFSNLGIAPPGALLTGTNTGYIAQYTSAGNWVASHSLGNGASEGKGIHVAGASVYFTGSFQGTVDFDFSTGGTAYLNSFGADDYFVSKLGVGPTGIVNFENENTIVVCPNPSNGLFSVKTESAKGVGNVKVMNSLGQIIYQIQNPSSDNLLLDLSNQPKGIYFIMMNVGDKAVQQKIIIE